MWDLIQPGRATQSVTLRLVCKLVSLVAAQCCIIAASLGAKVERAWIDSDDASVLKLAVANPVSRDEIQSLSLVRTRSVNGRMARTPIPFTVQPGSDSRRIALRLAQDSVAEGLIQLTAGSETLTVEDRSGLIPWDERVERHWIGPDFWGNRLQDWRIRFGRLECLAGGPRQHLRTVHLLTRSVQPQAGSIRLSVRTGVLEAGSGGGWSGFLIGAGAGELDYRASALVHNKSGTNGGILAVFDMSGVASFRSNNDEKTETEYPVLVSSSGSATPRGMYEEVQLDLAIEPAGPGKYAAQLTAWNYFSGELLASALLTDLTERQLAGSIALVSSSQSNSSGPRFWFRNFRASGSKLAHQPGRALGPVAGGFYTLNGAELNLAAQFMPLGFGDPLEATLETRPRGGSWVRLGTAIIESPGWVAKFTSKHWDSSSDRDYRILYAGKPVWTGRIRKDPKDQRLFSTAAFTCQMLVGRPPDFGWGANGYGLPEGRWTPENIWFPHSRIVKAVQAKDPDMVVFLGDQVYEGGSPTMREDDGRFPELDYLYRWIAFVWSLGELGRDRPSVMIPDDHDVYHANLWGWSGRRNQTGDPNRGGFIYEPAFVNMVQRTQTANLPAPADPEAVRNGIDVYFTSMTYGGISWAILEDRKFKTPFKDCEQGQCGPPEMFGARQLNFLGQWLRDWRGASAKVALMQTALAAAQTGPQGQMAVDRDSNGWPPEERNRAVNLLRKGRVFAIAGDTHLATVIQHGVERHRDGIFQYTVPATANKFSRWFEPAQPGANRKPGDPGYTGDFVDAFGNRITMVAAGNPKVPISKVQQSGEARDYHHIIGRQYVRDGFGLIVLDKQARTIRMENWPWDANPGDPSQAQTPGWPVTISIDDNDGRAGAFELPRIELGPRGGVVEITSASTGELISIYRTNEPTVRPRVFEAGKYRIRTGSPESGQWNTTEAIAIEARR